MKTCKKCKQQKPSDEFRTRTAHGKLYSMGTCRSCERASRRKDTADAIDGARNQPQAHDVEIDIEVSFDPYVVMYGLVKILFIPDTHRPYHDKRKWAVMMAAAREFKPDIIIILGDFADFYCVSDHSKNPARRALLKDELADVIEGLRELDTLGAKRKIYISGNHEDRYDRYISNRAPEFYDMMALRDLFKLKETGWEWVPYRQSLHLGKLHLTHDCGKAGKYAHYDAQQAFEGNAIIGHTHRLGYAVVGNAEGQPHVGAMFGWLGDIEQVDYIHRIRACRDWAHGFGIGYMTKDECVHVIPVPIVNDTVIIEGRLVGI